MPDKASVLHIASFGSASCRRLDHRGSSWATRRAREPATVRHAMCIWRTAIPAKTGAERSSPRPDRRGDAASRPRAEGVNWLPNTRHVRAVSRARLD